MRATALLRTAVLVLAAAVAGAGSLPAWYRCTCPPAGAGAGAAPCVCPSTAAPGGLAPADTPQFVLFTHDDALTSTTNAAFHTVLDGKRSANGCPAAATFFTTSDYTDCTLTKALHDAGHEIADHTVHHYDLSGNSKAQVVDAVVGARAKLAACGIPAKSIAGFRQPYLSSNPTVRQVLLENGFLYDSTILETPQTSLSSGQGARVWPYTMQDGVPQNCAWFAPAQNCTTTERYPGLFEVPVWDLDAIGDYAMDYGSASQPAFDVLKANFDAAYAGNRAPFPIFVHTPWFSKPATNLADMIKFADYALSKPHVYFVTMQQLLAWMRNPVPASALTPAALGCGAPGGVGPARAAAVPSPRPPPPPSPVQSPPPPPPSPSPASPPPEGTAGSMATAGAPQMASISASPPAAVPVVLNAVEVVLLPSPSPPTFELQSSAPLAQPPTPGSDGAAAARGGSLGAALACALALLGLALAA
ncbi:polysaccharide deacetylase [Micractinium conductrix]|uniref:Polysaccharide deacetylase n=1 Tax=Micractinium conductrix TaxID=554055 RepID=A0A2P6VIX1_9CHLO|nr:polysaccharide deacetylase [Micractinium conductrix]|eukprot:PSC74020.1 polysaccharide deacetylase [Micractinium conductrix]